jgi:hypothetical protein
MQLLRDPLRFHLIILSRRLSRKSRGPLVAMAGQVNTLQSLHILKLEVRRGSLPYSRSHTATKDRYGSHNDQKS